MHALRFVCKLLKYWRRLAKRLSLSDVALDVKHSVKFRCSKSQIIVVILKIDHLISPVVNKFKDLVVCSLDVSLQASALHFYFYY